MLRRSQRLSGREMRTLKARPAARSPFFSLKTAVNQTGHTRWAIVVGSAVDRRAVRRHTLKRRAAAFCQKLNLGGLDAVLIVHPSAAGLPAREFTQKLAELVKSI